MKMNEMNFAEYEETVSALPKQYNLVLDVLKNLKFIEDSLHADRDIFNIVVTMYQKTVNMILSSKNNKDIMEIQTPEQWILDGTQAPTIECKKYTVAICDHILMTYGFNPIRIASSIEDGIYLKYQNLIINKTMEIEVYNNLFISGMVSKDKKTLTLFNINIDGVQDFTPLIKVFSERDNDDKIS